ncbi:TIGR00730 family Rossman fold protein [Actinopolyspora halophila]|uniref:LOG family protein n=1 Tax=Actinopolyspora halophila TaxID=1850 RepID=UPI000382796C|nr:TIGR00730 family Rossman fold protein [Actinopolyspora halophila]
MDAICVFCGSNPGRDPAYLQQAEALGKLLAGQGVTVVYGGAGVGTMGVLARAALEAGGTVVGVIPDHLVEVELAPDELTELHRVETMHERKTLMAELSDGFIALPGGLGTLEEFAEIATWSQLGLHTKPTGLLNSGGFYDSLLTFLDHAVDEQFLRQPHRDLVLADADPERLLEAMRAWTAQPVPKWFDTSHLSSAEAADRT